MKEPPIDTPEEERRRWREELGDPPTAAPSGYNVITSEAGP